MSSDSPTAAAPDSDAEIVRLVRERDGRGLRLLLQSHGARTRGVLRRIFGGTLTDIDIDDALSRATFRAWRRIDSFDPSKGSLRAWYLTIARNASLEILRERRGLGWQSAADVEQLAAPTGADAAPAEADDPTVLTPAPSSTFLEILRQCIDALPRLQRQVIRADLQSGDVANAGELAAALRTTKNSIYVTRSNARKALKQALLRHGIDLGGGRHLSWT